MEQGRVPYGLVGGEGKVSDCMHELFKKARLALEKLLAIGCK